MNELNNTLDEFFNSTSKEVEGAINQTTLNESCDIIMYIMNNYTIGISVKSSETENYLNIIVLVGYANQKQLRRNKNEKNNAYFNSCRVYNATATDCGC